MKRLALLLLAMLMALIGQSEAHVMPRGSGAQVVTPNYNVQTDAGTNVQTDAGVQVQVDH